MKEGKNIIGGDYIGGNFWSNFSENCFDSRKPFGICDDVYSFDDIDYLPLASPVPKPVMVKSPINFGFVIALFFGALLILLRNR